MIEVSVIIPTYNHAHFLPEAVSSVYQQTFQDFEIIVVDDGSNDNTRDIVRGYTDTRFQYIYQTNHGLAAARNTGLMAAIGEFVAFLDADDIFLPCKLEVQVGWLRAHMDFGFNAGGWNYIDKGGTLIGGYKPWLNPSELNVQNWLLNCQVNPISVLVKKQWVEKVGGFDESLKQVEDWDLWLRLAYAGCKMDWVNETVCSYRFSPGQMTRNAVVQKKSSVQMMDKFFNQHNLSQELLSKKSEIYSHLYLISAGREYASGQVEDAQESLRKAVDYNPTLLRTWRVEQINDLISWTNIDWYNIDPNVYVKRIFDNLPEEAAALRKHKRRTTGEIAFNALFTSQHSNDWPKIRQSAITVALNDPHRFLNRRIWSILWQNRIEKRNTP